MKKDIESYMRSYAMFLVSKRMPGKSLGLLQQVANPTRPWEETSMDFIVELLESGGNIVIWTVVDLFYKQAHFIAPDSPRPRN